MAVNVEIKKTGIAKKLTIQQIVKMKKLGYGVLNTNYTLEWNQFGDYTTLFDLNCIGRGIEISMAEDCLYLRLPLPSTPSEITLFYQLTQEICKKLRLKEFVRDEDIVSIANIDQFIALDKQTSLTAIKSITQQIDSGESKNFVICCAFNPITLGEIEIQEINQDLENFETVLNTKQQLDVYYATPRFYKLENGDLFGMYFIGKDIVSVVPLDPMSPFHRNNGIENYYVFLSEQHRVKYEDFINHVNKIGDYDSDHIIISLNEDMINDLISSYSID